MDVMLDLETLGISPGCTILSIGACSLDQEHTFYQTISIANCVERGLTREAGTLAWWDKQAPEIRAEAFSGTTNLIEALGQFHDWFRKLPAKKKFIWSNGADFDIPILAFAYRLCGMHTPWEPFNGRCYRTMKNLYRDIPMVALEGGVKHNALDDATAQAQHLRQIFQEHYRKQWK